MYNFGHPCHIDEIIEICNNYNIPSVQDVAESVGCFFKSQHTGTFGEIGVLTFNGNKVITTGGGEILLFKDETLAKKVKHLTAKTKVLHPWALVHDVKGYNYRMPNFNAALVFAQIEQLPHFLKSKRHIAAAYKNFFTAPNHTKLRQQPQLTNIPHITVPAKSTSNYWLNSSLLTNLQERIEFLKVTNQKGIMTRPVLVLMNHLPTFNTCQMGSLENANFIAERLVNIPRSAIVA